MANGNLVLFTAEEVAAHNTAESLYIIIEDKVYDVTKFLEEHPGGDQVLLQMGGQDATISFQDVGHSKDAWTMTQDYLVGRLIDSERRSDRIKQKMINECMDTWKDIILSPTWSNFLIPVGISIIVYGLYSGAKVLFTLIL